MSARLLTIALACVVPLSSAVRSAGDDSWTIHPTEVPKSRYKVYVPISLEDAFVELRKMLPPQAIEKMRSGTEEEMSLYHLSLGMWIRNNWGLWGGSRLSKYFNGLGLHHPDDMSALILSTFWCHLNSKPLRVQERIAEYQAYWRKSARREQKTK